MRAKRKCFPLCSQHQTLLGLFRSSIHDFRLNFASNKFLVRLGALEAMVGAQGIEPWTSPV
jgi:hypothetical protein